MCPSPRTSHRLTYDELKQRTVLYGSPPLPLDPMLVGQWFWQQFLIADLGASALGITTSNAGEGHIGVL